jgi:hypothetical protein
MPHQKNETQDETESQVPFLVLARWNIRRAN